MFSLICKMGRMSRIMWWLMVMQSTQPSGQHIVGIQQKVTFMKSCCYIRRKKTLVWPVVAFRVDVICDGRSGQLFTLVHGWFVKMPTHQLISPYSQLFVELCHQWKENVGVFFFFYLVWEGGEGLFSGDAFELPGDCASKMISLLVKS